MFPPSDPRADIKSTVHTVLTMGKVERDLLKLHGDEEVLQYYSSEKPTGPVTRRLCKGTLTRAPSATTTYPYEDTFWKT